MIKILLANLLHLAIIFPIVFFTLKNRKKETFKILLVFCIYFLIRSILLELPLKFRDLSFFNGKWNWSGKILAILSSIFFLLLYKKFSPKDYFLTLKQNPKFTKKGILIITTILGILSVLAFLYNSSKEWDTETILYQLTMPGIDEEIAYRGIMLGLLVKVLKSNKFLHPAILVTALLFGMAHGLSLTHTLEVKFYVFSFLNTTILGIIWAWITLKSRSILLALISHNLGNTTNRLISIFK